MTGDIDQAVPLPAPEEGEDTREWVDLAAASKATGLSVSALRKRYREGRVTSRVVAGKRGPKREVDLAELRASRRPGPSTGPVAAAAALIPLAAWEQMRAHYLEAQAKAVEAEVRALIAEHDLTRAKAEAELDLTRAKAEAARLAEELNRVRAELDAARARRRWWRK